MNLYGFAGGDPVNATDPFGLRQCDKDHPEDCEKQREEIQRAQARNLKAIGDLFALGQISEALSSLGSGVGVGTADADAAATVDVVHFTSAEGAAAIEESGALRANSFVALPAEVAGKSASAVESLLEIGPGRGGMSARFRVPADALKTPFNGPVTSGGAKQFQLTRAIPLKPGSFIPTP